MPAFSRPIVLGSASPRRRDLLAAAGVEFAIDPADVDETIDLSLTPGEAAEDLALRKALTVAARVQAGTLVVGADTLVVLGGEGGAELRYLEKAADEAEAASMLGALSGTRHRVITGVSVVLRGRDGRSSPATEHETTFVTMRRLESDEIDAYVASGEWRGKAGGYAIQETADRFVTGLEGGGFDNVVGLPVERTIRMLTAAARLTVD